MYCGAGEEKLFAERFACWTCPFYTLSDREFVTEKIFRSPVQAAEIRVRYWVLLIIVQVIVSCMFEIYWEKWSTRQRFRTITAAVTNISVQVLPIILPIFHESSAHSASHQNGFDFICPPALSDIVISSSWDHWKWLPNFRKKTTTFWYWKTKATAIVAGNTCSPRMLRRQNQVLLVAFNNRSIVVVVQALMINGRFFRIVPVAHKNQLCHEANFQWSCHIHGTRGFFSPKSQYQWMESNFQWRILSTHQLPKLQFTWIPLSWLENWLWTLWEQNSALD